MAILVNILQLAHCLQIKNSAYNTPPDWHKGFVLKRIIKAALPVALLFSSSVAHAGDPAPNPISNFLSTLQKIAAGPNGSAPKEVPPANTPEHVGGNSEADDIMKSVAMENGALGSASASTCQYYLNDDGKIVLAQKTGKFTDAAIMAQLRAANIAACSIKGIGPTGAAAKDEVGQLLAVSSINFNRGGMVTDSAALHAKYAQVLLMLNARDNEALLSELEKAYWPKGPVTDAQAFAIMTAKDAVAKYKDNTFAFRRNYTNKTIQVKGRVERITGSDNSASIVLDGETNKSKNDKGWQDSVMCNIKNSQAMDDAARISSGSTVNVRGIFVPGLLPGVSLDDCRLVR